MLFPVFLHQPGIGVRVAVFAEMSAGIVCADIDTEQAGTLPVSLICLSFWHI